ncbi:CpsD/CapB family tyrosine-protein kinase [Novosphingobium sp. MD-1]|uniref:CpsD/CapB family tyrosine-protein kinase n=1 Tax=Novosphingobium sp. MD-1 TaxID=1630648 RepID=UPI00061C350B|nr:CpsD/CapB family tyrosine-protein kinase [Novosphingobium sp. MD-1]GAO55325.1 tyrosine-protein kinase Wzc [Novosphingobium sp. MD-1]
MTTTNLAVPAISLPAVVPPVSYTLSEQVVVASAPDRADAESISALRNHLVAKHIHEGRRGLTICATEREDGAAWLAVNLAASLAQTGVRTLLIDCDLRGGTLGDFIQPSAPVAGLADVLASRDVSVASAMQFDVMPNLSVMYAGNPPGNAQELLFGQRFGTLIDLCLRDFDLTIATAPATKFYADARRIAALMRYALVVARKDSTLVSDLKTLIDDLTSDGVRVIGSVYKGD